jgi:acyl carrier protein
VIFAGGFAVARRQRYFQELLPATHRPHLFCERCLQPVPFEPQPSARLISPNYCARQRPVAKIKRRNSMLDNSEFSIQARIVQFISDELGIAEREIDPDTNLGAYGLESVAASKLIGTLEKEYGLELSAIFVFEFPTIMALSEEIHKLTAVRAG